jgi:pilus assembly protein CpaC
MIRGLSTILAGVLVLAAVPAAAADARATRVINVATHSGSAPQQHITLGLDKAALVQLDTDARDVLVSNPAVVDAVVRTPRRIFLLAQKTGQTNAFFFDGAGHQILTIDIRVERDVTDLATMIHNDMPNSNIRVAALNDNVVLTGMVQSTGDSQRAQDLAARFVGDPNKVANLLKIDTSQQVMLKVRVAEMQRSVAKQFGINAAGAFKIAGVPVIAQTSNPYGLAGSALSLASGAQIGSVGSDPLHPSPNNVQGVLNALEQVGLVHTLAEPNLTAVSGETAKFLAGGEFPVPVSRDQYGNVTVAFKQFGVGLSFTPVVMSPNNISLQISSEVSELTNTGAFTQAGGSSTTNTGSTTTVPSLTIPALSVRRAETTVEVPSGGSFAIAGLMQHATKQTLDQFPGLGDMPVLGALFRSRDFQNDETELVVVATAYLVKPGKEKDFASPGDGFVPPADAETILLGRLNATYKNDPQGLKSAGAAKTGFIVE